MIFITGDTHIPHDVSKLNTKNFPKSKILTKDDFLIICGDFGAVWEPDSRSDAYWQKWLDTKPFTTLFVDGNHENFDLLEAYPVQEKFGGKVHQIKDSVFHLMRGQVFEIDGKTIFTMGGGGSGDTLWRTEGKSWWPRELPSEEEYEEARSNLARYHHKVNLIITHTAPHLIANQFRVRWNEHPLGDFLTWVQETVSFDHWYFGHMHEDVEISEKMETVYDRIVPI